MEVKKIIIGKVGSGDYEELIAIDVVRTNDDQQTVEASLSLTEALKWLNKHRHEFEIV